MFESLSRGWAMTKASFKVLSLDKEILVLPLMSAVIMIAAVLGVGYGAFGLQLPNSTIGLVVTIWLVYFAAYAVTIFFNASVIEMATIRFNGGDPVVKDGLKKSWSKVNRILQWAVVAATVGLVLALIRQAARDRNSLLGQILAGVAETAWNIAAFFAVPIAIYQDVGPIDALKMSVSRMKRTFGESITGIATTGIVFFVLGLLGAIPMYLGIMMIPGVLGYALAAVAVVYWIILAAVNSAVSGILVAALYKYSTDGNMPDAYAQQGVDAQALAW